MPKFFQTLGRGFSRYWYRILFSCLVIAYLLWLFVISESYELTFGLSRDVFNIFCGSLATLFGILLGLVIAAVAFVVQSSFSGLSANIDILSREGGWLESWLRSETVKNIGLVGELQKLCNMCKLSLIFDAEEINSHEVANAWSNMRDAFENSTDEHNKKLDEYRKQLNALKEKTKTEIDEEEVLELEEQVRQTIKEMQSLDNLMYHVHVAFTSLYRVISLRLSAEIRKMLIQLAYIISAILVMSLIFLALSGAESFGAELLSNFNRLNLAIALGIGFMAILPLLFQILNIHLRIVSR